MQKYLGISTCSGVLELYRRGTKCSFARSVESLHENLTGPFCSNQELTHVKGHSIFKKSHNSLVTDKSHVVPLDNLEFHRGQSVCGASWNRIRKTQDNRRW